MFGQQSRAKLVTPMSVPPGSPRQSVGGGKGGGAVNAPAGGGKGGGQAMASPQPTMFDMARLGPSIGSGMQAPAVSPQPTMFGQGNLNTALGSGFQSLPAMPIFGQPQAQSGAFFGQPNLSQAIGASGMSALPPAQPVVANQPPALPTGIVGRLYGLGGI